MQSLKIRNFRSIKDSGEISLKPITIILGKNSCGKSSFIRIFPLLKQSLEKDISEPLLWYGDYVDFGDYSNIVPYNNKFAEFKMSFKLSIINTNLYFNMPERKSSNIDIEINIKFEEKNIKYFEFKFFDQHVKCKLKKDGEISLLEINNFENVIEVENYLWRKSSHELLPNIYNKTEDYRRQYPVRFYYIGMDSSKEFVQIIELIKKHIGIKHKKTDFYSRSDADRLIESLIYPQEKSNLLTMLKKSNLTSKFFSNKTIDDEDFCKLNNLIVFLCIRDIIRLINYNLNIELNHTFYLKPLRANVNRYYRVQGINVDNVDSDGSNLPMILYNLGSEKTEFEKWCETRFGLKFKVEVQSGHVSLIVEDLEKRKTNLADTGYGYSQVLPILVQLWLIKSRQLSKYDKSDTFGKINVVIEQPELHLHPAFQSKIMDIFVGLVNEAKEDNIRIIFETHSSTMINRLGYLVSNKTISKESVNIVLVEKKNDISNFKQTTFKEDGSIDKWPIGFMSFED